MSTPIQKRIAERVQETSQEASKEYAQVHSLITSHQPHLKGNWLYIFLDKDGLPIDVLLPYGKNERNSEIRELLRREYTSLYHASLTDKPLCEVARQIRQELLGLVTPQETQGSDEAIIIAGEATSYVHFPTDTIYKVSRDKPIAIGRIPHVKKVLRNYDESDKPEVTYEVEIAGKTYFIPHQKLIKGTFSDLLSNTSGLANRYNRDTYSNAIFHMAINAPQVTSVKSTGFHSYQVAGKEVWAFMLPNGRLITYDDKPTSSLVLSPSLKDTSTLWDSYEKKIASQTPEDIAEAYQFLKGVTPNGVSLIIASHVAMCVGYGLTSDDFRIGHTLYIYGEGGTGKSELTQYCMGLVIPYAYKGIIDATFNDSMASMELEFNMHRHLPIMLDDLTRGKNDTSKDMKRKIETQDTVSRSAFSRRAVRKRANPDMTRKASTTVETLPLSNGEAFLTGINDSALRRMLTIGLIPQDIHRTYKQSQEYCLENYKKYTYAHFALGRYLEKMVAIELTKHGKEATSQKHQKICVPLKEKISERLSILWAEKQYTPLPNNVDSIIEIGSHILLGSYLLDIASQGATSFVADTLTPLVRELYNHLCLANNLTPDKNMTTPLGEALSTMIQHIENRRAFKLAEGTRYLRLSPTKGTCETSTHITDEGERVTYDLSDKVNEKVYEKDKPLIAMYFKMAVENNLDTATNIYLTDTGIEALLSLIQQNDDYQWVDNPDKLLNLMIQEQWLITPETGKNRKKSVRVNGEVHPLYEIHLDLFVKVTGISQEDETSIAEDTATPEATTEETRKVVNMQQWQRDTKQGEVLSPEVATNGTTSHTSVSSIKQYWNTDEKPEKWLARLRSTDGNDLYVDKWGTPKLWLSDDISDKEYHTMIEYIDSHKQELLLLIPYKDIDTSINALLSE